MAQLTGSRSMTAAAEWSVTFGDCSYRWKARLLSCLGSSAAQGTGGRVRTPAPTEYPETRLSLRRGRSQTGPRAHTVRPYGMAWAARPGGRALRASWFTEGGRPHGAGKRTGSVGSAEPGAVVKPQQRQFLHAQGPVARREFRPPLRFCAPEMFCPPQGVTPVMGVLGADSPCQGEMSSAARQRG